MEAIQISRTGGRDVLEHVEVPTPKPGPGEVLVKAEAIGVNYFDLLFRTGKYRWMPKLPFILGNEMSGRVVDVGSGVTTLKMGDPVFIAGYEIENRGGMFGSASTGNQRASSISPSCGTISPPANTRIWNLLLVIAATRLASVSAAP